MYYPKLLNHPLDTQSIEQIEIWKDIPNYEGLYLASTFGRIKNRRGKVLKPNKTIKGYYHITLYDSCISPKTFKLHRIIGLTFLHKPFDKNEINHKNGIKSDNNVENLEWCDKYENQRHAVKMGLNVARKGIDSWGYGKFRGDSARAKLVLDTNTGVYYDCAKDAAEARCMTYNQLKNRLTNVTPNYTGLIYV